MGYHTLQIQGVGEVPGNVIQLGMSAEQNPEKREQQNRENVLFPIRFHDAEFILSADKKEHKNRCNNQNIEQNNESFEVPGEPELLHSFLSADKNKNFFD